MDNARERRFGNGREPRVLWKNHADFIAILLQSGGGSEGKDRDPTREAALFAVFLLLLSTSSLYYHSLSWTL